MSGPSQPDEKCLLRDKRAKQKWHNLTEVNISDCERFTKGIYINQNNKDNKLKLDSRSFTIYQIRSILSC